MFERLQFIPMMAEHIKSAAILRTKFTEYGYMSHMDVGFWEFFFSKIILLPEAIAYVAINVENQKIVGFIIGTTDDAVIKKSLLKGYSFFITFFYMSGMLMRNPHRVGVLIQSMFSRIKRSVVLPSQRWITWIVDCEYQKCGVGMELYKYLCTGMNNADVSFFYAPVDCNNDISNRAQIKIGAINDGSIFIEGREHYLWKHESAKWAFL